MLAPSLSVPSTASAAPSDVLSRAQIVRLVGWAILLWLLAALFIRNAPAEWFAGGTATLLLFASALPVGWAGVRGTRRIASLRTDQLVPGTAICAATAMLCDGIAFTWSSLYGTAEGTLVPAAAWLLWGVGLMLIVSVVIARSERA